MNQLEAELKKAMEYTDKSPPRCADCYYCEMMDGFIDRTWDYVCNYNKISSLAVSEYGRCKFFEKKNK